MTTLKQTIRTLERRLLTGRADMPADLFKLGCLAHDALRFISFTPPHKLRASRQR